MPLELYGLNPKGLENARQADIELMLAFNPRLFAAKGWLGRFPHLRNAIDHIWNFPRRMLAKSRELVYDPRKHDAYIWNDWTELLMRAFCEHKGRTVTGPNASWKTTSAALYHLCAWFAIPMETLVIVTSTSRDGLKARFWKELVRYYRSAGAPFGNLVQSDIALQTVKGSLEAGIFGVATGQDNDVDKAVSKILGRHNTYTYACVDEMQATNEGLVKGAVSLEAGADNFEFTGLGNAENELDPHGQMSEPIDGWDSITAETEMWATKMGVCIHLDGLRCPRVLEGDDLYPGLLRQEQIDSTIRNYGEDSPEFWSKRRGFWAPQGVQKTVLSVALITRGKAREKAIWAEKYVVGAGLDPSFEGQDRCVLRIFHCGISDTGLMTLALKEIIIIKVSVTSAEPIHYQIARRVKEECTQRAIPPTMFAMDSTGEGGGLASIIVREWGPGILMVEFGGRCSSDPVSETNPKRADLEYDRKVTELAFRFRTLVMNGQVRELDLETATEFCQRKFGMKGNLISVETKTEMKGRTRKSPDLADNAVVGAELMRKRGHLKSPESETNLQSSDRWREIAKRFEVAADYAEA